MKKGYTEKSYIYWFNSAFRYFLLYIYHKFEDSRKWWFNYFYWHKRAINAVFDWWVTETKWLSLWHAKLCIWDV